MSSSSIGPQANPPRAQDSGMTRAGAFGRSAAGLLVAFSIMLPAGVAMSPPVSAQQGQLPSLVPEQSGAATVTETTEVAKVNGEPIFFVEITEMIGRLPPQLLQRIPPQELYNSLLASAIDRKLAAQAAAETDLMEDPEVQRRLSLAREEVLREVYLDQRADELITPEAVRIAYDRIVSEGGNDEIRARHILLETEADGIAVIKELEGGADFATLAQERSTGPSASQGGDLGFFTADRMVPEFAQAAFAMEEGQYSTAPVQTQFGWHVILVEEKREATPPPFQAMAPEIASGLRDEAKARVSSELRDGAEIEAYSPDGTALSPDDLPRQRQ